jgi:DNA invertase Pin-like site-specific DNA recombinase
MKRATLHARVSGDLQAREGTIESQVFALKAQIEAAGHKLVKEYLDNSFAAGADEEFIEKFVAMVDDVDHQCLHLLVAQP